MSAGATMSDSSPQAHRQPKFELRLASESDAEELASILADAFLQDPVARWVLPEPSFDEKFFHSDVALADIPAQHCWLESEGRGAACWRPPKARSAKAGLLKTIKLMVPAIMQFGLKPMRRGDILQRAFAKQRPKEPHYYLHMLGARQQFQGQGIGSALLKQGLRVVDENEMPAYLESSNIANVRLYERFGFTTLHSASLGKDGPTVWYMWRDAVNRS